MGSIANRQVYKVLGKEYEVFLVEDFVNMDAGDSCWKVILDSKPIGCFCNGVRDKGSWTFNGDNHHTLKQCCRAILVEHLLSEAQRKLLIATENRWVYEQAAAT